MGNQLTIVYTLEINGFEPVILKKYTNSENQERYVVCQGKNRWEFNFFNVSISYNRRNKYIMINGFVSENSNIQKSSIIQLPPRLS